MQEEKFLVFVMASRFYVNLTCCRELYCETETSNLSARMSLLRMIVVKYISYQSHMAKGVIMLMKRRSMNLNPTDRLFIITAMRTAKKLLTQIPTRPRGILPVFAIKTGMFLA